jgi:hypothetical protein
LTDGRHGPRHDASREGAIEASVQRIQTDFRIGRYHIERSEPKDDVVAQYTLSNDPAMSMSISNNFAAGIFEAVGKERAELIMPSAEFLMNDTGIYGETLIVKRYLVGDEQRLEFQLRSPSGIDGPYSLPAHALPSAFLPIFPNGWADVAKREGFELPMEAQEK